MAKELKIETSDEVRAVDKLDTFKRWINDVKHFVTVKILPPRR